MTKVKLHLIPFADEVKDQTAQGYVAIDINEIALWKLSSTGTLELWFKGITESVLLTCRQIPSSQLYKFLLLLKAQFPDIEDLIPKKDSFDDLLP